MQISNAWSNSKNVTENPVQSMISDFTLLEKNILAHISIH